MTAAAARSRSEGPERREIKVRQLPPGEEGSLGFRRQEEERRCQ
jgi:hypothetical protein